MAEAKLVRYDGNTGLAALTVDLEDLEDSTRNAITVMKTAGLNTIHKGSIVIALGSPLGTNYSILTGTITATNNEISTPDNNYSVYTTDIVASENGSGVLINMDGELVGVVMQSYSAASANTLTAVEISELMPVIDLLFADKEGPYFGGTAERGCDSFRCRPGGCKCRAIPGGAVAADTERNLFGYGYAGRY